MSLTRQRVGEFFRKNSFYLVGVLCLLISLCAIWQATVAVILFLATMTICSFFFDINKMLCLCSFSVCFSKLFTYGLVISFVISLSILSLREIVSKRKQLTKNYIYLIAIFAYFFATFFLIGFNKNNFTSIAQIIALIGILIEVFFLRTQINISFIIKSITIVLVTSCICSIPFVYNDWGIPVCWGWDSIFRFSGFFLHENLLAIMCALLCAFFVNLFIEKKIHPVEFCIYILSLFIIGYFTKSKSFLIAITILLLYYFVRTVIINWKGALIQFLVFAVVFVAICSIIPDKVYEYVSRFWIYADSSDYMYTITTGRTDIWYYYSAIWTATPLTTIFGCGGSFIFDEYMSTHNAFLDLLLKNGIVGAVLVIAFAICCYIFARKDKKSTRVNIPIIIMLLLFMAESACINVGILMIIITFAGFFAAEGPVAEDITENVAEIEIPYDGDSSSKTSKKLQNTK